MELKVLLFIIVLVVSFGGLFYSLYKKLGYLKIGQPDNRFDNIPERIKNVLKIAIGQSKIMRDPIAGPLHVMIFWGFLVFLFAVVEGIIQGLFPSFNLEFLGPFFTIISFAQDVFIVLVIIAIIFALVRRWIVKVDRLDVGPKGLAEATIILSLIMVVIVSMLGQNASLIAIHDFNYAEYEFRPVSMAISKIMFEGGADALTLFQIFWWIHLVVIFVFMNYLPYSKHFHVYTSIPNVFFQKLGLKKFEIKPLDLEDEDAEQFGVADVEHLTWKQMFDGYACTECGRCTSVCPAASTGKQLSPREIIVNIRKRTEEKAPLLQSGKEENSILENTLIHNYIKEEELWACTTCSACVYECPITIEHVDSIVEMRRNLVLMESQFPPELNTVFRNLETNSNPWAFNSRDRAEWAKGLDIKTMAEDSDCEYLFWVGCSGSFDARYQKVTQATVQLFNKASLSFRILGTEEKCNGDTARRLGNEYLAQMMMQENIEVLNNYKVKKIVTGCPHCFNSIKNEYPQFGGNFEVYHHSEIINKLLDEGKIKISDKNAKNRVTYHDSCYLGRYNGVYESPRSSISSIKGIELVEMERNKDRGFCCGAGGGRMFMEENEGTRINENRTEEALKTGADTIASACPFCMTMLSDGVKTFEKIDEVVVKDIAEIVLENSI